MFTGNPAIIESVDLVSFETRVVQSSHEQPVLVDIWAHRCAPCKALEPVLNRLQSEFSSQMQLAKVNADEDGGLSEWLAVRSLPTLMLYVDGEKREQLQGAITERSVRDILNPYTQNQPQVWFNQARSLMDDGYYTKALSKLRRAVSIAPDSADFLACLLNALMDTANGAPEHLLEAERWLAKAPSLVKGASLVQQSSSRLGLMMQTETGLDDRQEAYKLSPSVDNQLALARALAASGRFEDALVFLVERMEKIPAPQRKRYQPLFAELLNTMPDRQAANRYRRLLFSLIRAG